MFLFGSARKRAVDIQTQTFLKRDLPMKDDIVAEGDISEHNLQLEELQVQGCDCLQMEPLRDFHHLSLIFFGYSRGQAFRR